jgi:predicted metal-binding membrane protein
MCLVPQNARYVPAAVFLLGYLLVWTGFSLVATAIQFWLTSIRVLSMDMASASPLFAGGLLIGVGLFQWTPWKSRCLSHCSGPVHFLVTSWRDGWSGALAMGLRHGLFCLGCCWAVMFLLFTAGVMNPLWVAALSAFVLVEKLAPTVFSRPNGVVLATAGLWVMLH